MDSIYSGFGNLSSLFPSPVQSPVSCENGLDLWAEWSTNSNTVLSGISQNTSDTAVDPELQEMEALWWEGNFFPELNDSPTTPTQQLPTKTMYCTDQCTEYLNETAEQLHYKPETSPIVVLGVNLSSLADEFSWLPSIDEEHYKRYSQEQTEDDRGVLYQNGALLNQRSYIDAASAALASHDYTNRTLEPASGILLNNSTSPFLTPVTTPESTPVSFPFTSTPPFTAAYPVSPVFSAMPLHIHVNGVMTPTSPPESATPTKSHAEDKSFHCTFNGCKKIYAKSSHLKAHLRRHTGEKPFACTWAGCEWRFSRSDELSRHRRSHSGVKPYQCPTCKKGFSRSDHLAKHLKVHNRQRWLSYNGKGAIHMRREKKK